MWIPGYGVEDKTPKKSLTAEAHKQVCHYHYHCGGGGVTTCGGV